MRVRLPLVLLVLVGFAACDDFLDIPLAELCFSEPDLAACRRVQAQDGTASRAHRHRVKDGFVEQKGATAEDPFAEIATRAPPSSNSETDDAFEPIRPSPSRSHHRKGHRGRVSPREYYARMNEYYRKQEFRRNYHNGLYNIYPGLYPKDQNYCRNTKANFAFTCQPGKDLRVDLVEFCKDYSAFCNMPNFHRLPGPREGPPAAGGGDVGHVAVSGNFGLGIGAVPGLEVSAGWGVDVGPIPGMGESVGVNTGLNLGIVGAKSPEAYRRGMDNPNEKGGGVFGISGGVGVQAPGSGPIGVGSGIGVGK